VLLTVRRAPGKAGSMTVTTRSMRRPLDALALALVLGLGSTPLLAAPATAAPADVFDLPVEAFPDGGGWILTTWVSVNGSDPIRVALDTGTSVLVLNPGVVRDADPVPAKPGVAAKIVYDGTGVDGEVAEANVSVMTGPAGDVVATTPTAVGYVQGLTCPADGGCPHWGGRTDDGEWVINGVWGIGPNVMTFSESMTGTPTTPYRMFSPITQFAGASADGLSIDYTSDVPAVRVGPVEPGPQDAVVQRAAGVEPKPNGQQQWQDPELCWTISSGANVGAGCLVSRIDSGQAIGEISGSQYDGVVIPDDLPPENGSGKRRTGLVAPGALVSWTVPGQVVPFGGVVATESYPDFWGQYVEESGAEETNYNTGQNFYRLHVVRYDNVSGATYISPTAGVPAAPHLRSVISSAGEVTASWSAGDPGATPVLSWAVTVAAPDGTIVRRSLVAADAVSATIPGLQTDVAYAVSVAGVNSGGLGVASDIVVAVAGLPVTGAAPAAWWPGALVVVLGIVLLAVRRVRTPPRVRR
jgi:hypothetical protein